MNACELSRRLQVNIRETPQHLIIGARLTSASVIDCLRSKWRASRIPDISTALSLSLSLSLSVCLSVFLSGVSTGRYPWLCERDQVQHALTLSESSSIISKPHTSVYLESRNVLDVYFINSSASLKISNFLNDWRISLSSRSRSPDF